MNVRGRAEACITKQGSAPFLGHFGAAASHVGPHAGERGAGDQVVGHGNGKVQVEHGVPPAAWHKHRFAWLLLRWRASARVCGEHASPAGRELVAALITAARDAAAAGLPMQWLCLALRPQW